MYSHMLIDPFGYGFVVGGTLLATLVRVGWRNCQATLRQLSALPRHGFDLAKRRSELAVQVEAMRTDGVIRVAPAKTSDAELSAATQALCRHRSIEAMMQEHERYSAHRIQERNRALETLENAADTAPVVGLAGTLMALGQFPMTTDGGETAIMSSISLSVATTFYGLVLAHLFCLPLAGAVSRRGRREEKLRNQLFDWMATQLAPACPSSVHKKSEAA